MGSLKDMIDMAKSVADDTSTDLNKKARYRSLSKKAAEGTVQFPVIISSSLDIETAQNISKALERNFATFVQIVFSMDPSLSKTDGTTASDYIKKFHQNMDTHFSDSYDMYRNISELSTESIDTLIDTPDYVVMSAVYEGSTRIITADNREQLIDLMKYVRTDLLNNKYVPRMETVYNFNNPKLNEKYNSMRYTSVNEATNTKAANNKRAPAQQNQSDRYIPDMAKGLLTDNDVKKSNELVATTLHIRINLLNDDGTKSSSIDFIIGVKAIMHVVSSDEMIDNVVAVCKNDDAVFNFLRWTTGEISFFKDLLFNINNTKRDVANASAGASPWWLALKRRKSLARIMDAVPFIKKRLIPNATIVLSEDEAEFIKSEFGFDLHNRIFVNKIMGSYFLLGFVIVDSSSQIAHFMFDGQDDFQSVTFSALEKANTNDERKFKEMLKVINRI